jgi:hypothetical protein
MEQQDKDELNSEKNNKLTEGNEVIVESIEENEIQDDNEEEMDIEAEFPTRGENAHVIAMLYSMYGESDPITANGIRRKKNAMNKCLKIAKRYIDEIFDETFDITDNSEE